jgi:CRISPR-associated protein Csb2
VLAALAQDTSYVGHSSSLVRCWFRDDAVGDDGLTEHDTVAAPYSGRLNELETLHVRHQQLADASARPRPAPLPHPLRTARPEIACSVFGEHWIVLEHAGGDRPDMRAAVVWGRAMRDTLQKHWRGSLPEWLSGHAADGTPSHMPHLAVLPLGFVGFEHANGAWQGLALVLPRAVEDAVLGSATPAAYAMRQHFDRALTSAADSEGFIRLHVGKNGAALLRVISRPPPRSLSPHRYVAARRLWSTVTPIALDRHPDPQRADEEAADIIAAACLRIGLPKPSEVRIHKHPAITGAISAWPAGGAPRWTGWARPGPLANRPLTHATLRFKDPVAGPVILGAGRFFGLGLCLPIGQENTP